MREVVRGVARLGGFLGRKGDGEPGVRSLNLANAVSIVLYEALRQCGLLAGA